MTVAKRDGHADLDGVTEILVRPDGHVAWATRATDRAARAAGRHEAFRAWTGEPARSDGTHAALRG